MSAGLLKLVHAPEGLAVRIEPTDGAVWPTGRWRENPTVAVTDERVYNLIRDDIMTREPLAEFADSGIFWLGDRSAIRLEQGQA